MRRLLSFLYCLCLCLMVTFMTGDAQAKKGGGGRSKEGKKVCLCHVPPGNPANAHTICVGAPAVSSHLRHGDSLGSCQESCGGESGIPCDEGQFCKFDEGECADDAEGVCTDSPDVCPAVIDPVCGCDGTTYNNACYADAAGVAIEHPGPCEQPVACGGSAGDTCDEGQYCARPEGECAEDAEGICADTPNSCPTVLDPVCGCDEMTYDNKCLAAAAGVNVASTGACDDQGLACGGTAGDTCEMMDQFCKAAEGDCADDAEGVCTTRPTMCPAIFDRVCGCDRKTYENECMADAAGVTVAAMGPCETQGMACGGTAGDTCLEGEFCKSEEGMCAMDAKGVCAAIPLMCSSVIDPVCGCDGMTYDNECFAAAAGVTVAMTGECPRQIEICDDGEDNDGDELVDCLDPDCVEDPACAVVPANPVREQRAVR